MWMDLAYSLGSAVTGGSRVKRRAWYVAYLHATSLLPLSFSFLFVLVDHSSPRPIASLLAMINAAGLSARLPTRGAIPAFRAQRHFSSARPALKEIQDAYILSASRTPTAKVKSC